MKVLMIASFMLSLTIAASACNPQQEEKKEATKATQPEAKVAVEAATPAEALTLPELSPEEPKTKLGELPVAEDLEDEAAKTVNIDNVDLELDRLEAEIDG